MKFTGHATLSAVQQHTGRLIVADTTHGLVQDWALSNDYAADPAHCLFLDALLDAVRVEETPIICYRGRRVEGAAPPSSKQMGPPPEAIAPEGRYSRKGCPVLYLCQSEEGVKREPIGGTGPLWVKEYQLPASLRIADLSVDRIGEFMNRILWFAEHSEESAMPNPPLAFSQYVGEVVSTRFDGMLVPGVRGDRSYRYSNVVVFNRLSEWASWVDVDVPPFRNSIRGRSVRGRRT